MKKYISKRPFIYAVQFNGDNYDEIFSFLEKYKQKYRVNMVEKYIVLEYYGYGDDNTIEVGSYVYVNCNKTVFVLNKKNFEKSYKEVVK